MDIAAPTEPQDATVTDIYEITWKLRVLPLMPEDLDTTLERHKIEDLAYVFAHPTSPKVARWARAVAKKYVLAIIDGSNKDGPASFNSKPVTDPEVRAALLERHWSLARIAAIKACDFGGVVVEQRGNSQSASA